MAVGARGARHLGAEALLQRCRRRRPPLDPGPDRASRLDGDGRAIRVGGRPGLPVARAPFLIAKVCAGLNFMIAAFGMTMWMLSRRAASVASATAVFGISALIAY